MFVTKKEGQPSRMTPQIALNTGWDERDGGGDPRATSEPLAFKTMT